jgi:hypothetical protein
MPDHRESALCVYGDHKPRRPNSPLCVDHGREYDANKAKILIEATDLALTHPFGPNQDDIGTVATFCANAGFGLRLEEIETALRDARRRNNIPEPPEQIAFGERPRANMTPAGTAEHSFMAPTTSEDRSSMFGLFDSSVSVGSLLQTRRAKLGLDVDAVAQLAAIAPERLTEIEAWTPDGVRWTIPLQSEAEAVAVALDTDLTTLVAEAEAQGARAVIVGVPPDKARMQVVPSMVYMNAQKPQQIPDIDSR